MEKERKAWEEAKEILVKENEQDEKMLSLDLNRKATFEAIKRLETLLGKGPMDMYGYQMLILASEE